MKSVVAAHHEVFEYVIDQLNFLVDHFADNRSDTAGVLQADEQPKDDAILDKSCQELPVGQIGVGAVESPIDGVVEDHQ